MNRIREKIHRINCLTNDADALYHQAALKLGLSDSAMLILYMLHYQGDGCPLSQICHEGGISKQTINSALRKLESESLIYLAQNSGRTKCVFLTEKGKEYVSRTGARLFDAECRALSEWKESEIDLLLELMEKYNRSFAAQLQDL